MKSLLRYPGGKTRALKHITPYFPRNLTEMVSPFFGGGSVELHYAAQGVRVHGYDIFEPLVNFWQNVLVEAPAMAHTLEGALYPCSKENFKHWQERVTDMSLDPSLRASVFYVINRCSFSGATLSGGMSLDHPRYTQSSIDRLRDFKCDNLTVECASFEDSLRRHDDETFIYADPPYLLERSTLYGERGSTHKDFDHHRFAEEIKKKNNWVISYNPHPDILELYKGYEVVYPEWSYGMSSDKKSSELLILNIKEKKK